MKVFISQTKYINMSLMIIVLVTFFGCGASYTGDMINAPREGESEIIIHKVSGHPIMPYRTDFSINGSRLIKLNKNETGRVIVPNGTYTIRAIELYPVGSMKNVTLYNQQIEIQLITDFWWGYKLVEIGRTDITPIIWDKEQP